MKRSVSLRSNVRIGALLSVACLLALALCADSAGAAVTVESFSFGTSSTQAGAHADLSLSLSLEDPGEPEAVKDLDISTPPGVFVYPEAIPRCSAADFGEFECAPSSQAGLITVRANHEGDPNFLLGTAPVYSLAPGPGEIVRLGFVVPTLDIPVTIPVSVRTGTDYGLDFSFQGFTQSAPLAGLDLNLWAVPAASTHDSQRFAQGSPAEPAGCPGVEGTGCIGSGTPSSVPQLPLLRNPTACASSLTSTLEADSYQDPGDLSTVMFAGPGITGCHLLAFDPRLTASLTTAEARTASGLDLDIAAIEEMSPEGLSMSDTKSIAVTLPPGLVVNRSAAETQSACSESEFESLGPSGPAGCADDSKIGTFAAGVSGFEAPLEGSVYFGGLESSGVYRLFLSASGSSMNVKFVGLLGPDPETGQASIAVSNVPQFPFDDFDLEIASGSRLFVTPDKCGSYEVSSVFMPWSSPSESFVLDAFVGLDSGPGGGPCPGPAEHVVVSLAPSSVLANGNSVTTATATVSDAHGYGIGGDEVTFLSSDPGEQIGPVTDNGDGSYTAQITSSTTPGTATITATDLSVEPEVFGTTTLLQLEGEHLTSPITSSGPPSPDTQPPDTKIFESVLKRRTPIFVFHFQSSEPGPTFRCKLDKHPFAVCPSSERFGNLQPGRHVLEVAAVDTAGNEDPTPAVVRFKLPERSQQRREHRRAGD